MKKLLIPLFGMAAMSAAPANAQDCCKADSPGYIAVSATGTHYAPPDQASVSAGVVTQGRTAGDAMAANASRMAAVYGELERAGIPRHHIKTSQLSLQPRYDYSDRQSPMITGYEARNTVTVKTNDLARVGGMLDALVRAGANNINNVAFSVKDDAAARSEARKAAVEAARRKAEEIAAAAGVTLGDVASISEGQASAAPIMRMRAASFAADAPETIVSSGEQGLSVTVNVTYEIIQ